MMRPEWVDYLIVLVFIVILSYAGFVIYENRVPVKRNDSLRIEVFNFSPNLTQVNRSASLNVTKKEDAPKSFDHVLLKLNDSDLKSAWSDPIMRLALGDQKSILLALDVGTEIEYLTMRFVKGEYVETVYRGGIDRESLRVDSDPRSFSGFMTAMADKDYALAKSFFPRKVRFGDRLVRQRFDEALSGY